MAFSISVQLDEAGLSSVDRLLTTYEGQELLKRINNAVAKELRTLVGPLRAAEQASGIKNRSGQHLRSIKVKRLRKRFGETVAMQVGPTDNKAHLLVQGHRVVTHRGVPTGKRARAFPYVNEIAPLAEAAVERIGSDVWAESINP